VLSLDWNIASQQKRKVVVFWVYRQVLFRGPSSRNSLPVITTMILVMIAPPDRCQRQSAGLDRSLALAAISRLEEDVIGVLEELFHGLQNTVKARRKAGTRDVMVDNIIENPSSLEYVRVDLLFLEIISSLSRAAGQQLGHARRLWISTWKMKMKSYRQIALRHSTLYWKV